jgi:pyruvate kinase
MADLPGPKMRIGPLEREPIKLRPGDFFTLTTKETTGNDHGVSVSFKHLLQTVNPGDTLYLNDGFIQLKVIKTERTDIQCRVLVGGELRSRKGLNLPGIDLGMTAFTDHDHDCLKFAMEQGVDAVSQSFVEGAADVAAVRDAASKLGQHPFIIAKIERSRALDRMEEILEIADGIMIARGDLGVEIPIEEIAVVQKRLMNLANMIGKPVITATQMLESMTSNKRPTRAESTDVANAILDGTDCVMLSEESATGMYPVEATTMLAKIAAAIEPHRRPHGVQKAGAPYGKDDKINLTDLIALSVENTVERISPAVVIVPTRSGATARSITRFRLPVWITAVSSQDSTCQRLLFSYGIHPVYEPDHPDDWKAFAGNLVKTQGLEGSLVVLTEGPSRKHPQTNNRMELIDLER